MTVVISKITTFVDKNQSMKTLEQWYSAYGESHQNKTNKKIHYICVPTIYISIVGMLMSIPNNFLIKLFHSSNFYIINWAAPFIILLSLFYFRLSKTTALRMLLLSILAIIFTVFISQFVPVFYFNLGLFILAWIGQFYGHKIEGKKPSFFEDLQFLLIGPAWVIDNLIAKKNDSF